jgi:hypothetical protein
MQTAAVWPPFPQVVQIVPDLRTSALCPFFPHFLHLSCDLVFNLPLLSGFFPLKDLDLGLLKH